MPIRLLFASLFLAFTITAPAALIINPGFESNILANPNPGAGDNFIIAAGQGTTITAVPGWTFTATQIDSFTSYGGVSDLATANHAPEGAIDNNIAWLFIGAGKQTGTIRATQTLGETLQANTRYTLTLRVAQSTHAEGNPMLANPAFPTLGNGVSTGDVFARLYVGSPGTAMPGFQPTLSSVSVPADDTWVNWTLTWETGAVEALAGTQIGIDLFNRADTRSINLPVEVFFDDLVLEASSIPEPSTVLMPLLLLVGIGFMRLRAVRVCGA